MSSMGKCSAISESRWNKLGTEVKRGMRIGIVKCILMGLDGYCYGFAKLNFVFNVRSRFDSFLTVGCRGGYKLPYLETINFRDLKL
jgi:hypothetical protein